MTTNNDHYNEAELLASYFFETANNSELLQQKLTDVQQIEQALQTLMALCGQDDNNPDLDKTPFRVVKAFLEYTSGYREDPTAHLEKVFDIQQNDPIIVIRYRILFDVRTSFCTLLWRSSRCISS